MGDAFERGAPLSPYSFPLLALVSRKPKAKWVCAALRLLREVRTEELSGVTKVVVQPEAASHHSGSARPFRALDGPLKQQYSSRLALATVFDEQQNAKWTWLKERAAARASKHASGRLAADLHAMDCSWPCQSSRLDDGNSP